MKIRKQKRKAALEYTRIATARMEKIIRVPAPVTDNLTPLRREDGPYNWENEIDWGQGDVVVIGRWYSPLFPWEFLFER